MVTRVIVTGANGHVGQRLLERLWDTSAETYAVTRHPASLQASRVFTSALDADRVQKAVFQSDVAVHLAGTILPKASNTYFGANVATAAALARAAVGSNIKRIIFLSYINADRSSTNEFLQTKAQAEDILEATGIPTVVFRCAHIIGSPRNPGPTAIALRSIDGEPVKVPGAGRQIVVPISVDDVVSAILLAIDKGRGGVYELSGPERMSMDDLVRMVNQNLEVPIRHLPERLATFLSKVIPGVPSALVDVMMRSSAGNPSKAIKEFGLRLSSLTTIWKTHPGVLQPEVFLHEKSETIELTE